jgi:hypothetical protein
MLTPALTVRLATAGDAAPLWSRSPQPVGERSARAVLIADHRGVPVAAVSLTSGAVVAGRSPLTRAAVALLRRRRYQLLRQGGRVAPLASLRRRPAAPAGAGA